MNVQEIFHRHKDKLNYKLLVSIAVLVVVVLFCLFFSAKTQVLARDYLPSDTFFYYEWTNPSAFDEKFLGGLISEDINIPKDKLDGLREAIGEQFVNVDQVVWFRSGSDPDKDVYIVRFSRFTKDSYEQITKSQPDIIFSRPNNQILVYGGSKKQHDSIPQLVDAKFARANRATGINMYWQFDYSPEFLLPITHFFASQSATQEIFINVEQSQGLKIDIYEENFEALTEVIDVRQVRMPSGFRQVTSLQVDHANKLGNFIEGYLLSAAHLNLPDLEIASDNIQEVYGPLITLIDYDSGWLLVGGKDWQSVAHQLAQSYKVSEVERTLADGTTYIEYFSRGNSEKTNHHFLGSQYWQIDGLYGLEIDGLYYLSNSSSVLEKAISSGQEVSNSTLSCVSGSDKISDFLYWQVEKIKDDALRGALEDKQVSTLKVIKYSNPSFSGVKLCL